MKKLSSHLRIIIYLLAGLAGILALILYATIFTDLPSPHTLTASVQTPTVRIVDRQGQLLYNVLDSNGGRNTILALSDIPLNLQQATIATEDKNFYTNPGVDLAGITRAFWINLRGGEVIAGGSTITQQTTRTLLLSEEQGERTIRRKLRESWLSWRVARIYDKETILNLYLNHTYYGALSYGVEAAAQTYFGKSAPDLTLAESALIAGLPQAPGAYNPFINPDSAKERQEVVLELMLKANYIDQDQYDLARQEPLHYAGTPYPVTAPHFVMMVQQEIDARFTPQEIEEAGGLTVVTTLDLDWQEQAEQIVRVQLNRLNEANHNAHNSALVATRPQTGEILALVGNADYFDAGISGAINMVLTPRQPGSSIKPLIYAAAMSPDLNSIGQTWTAATMIPDIRTTFITAENNPYVPANFSRDENGPVLLRQALGSSLNIPAVVALDHIGLDTALDFSEKMGITNLDDRQDYGLSFALGGGEVRLLDLTTAFSVFANEGVRRDPFFILEIQDAQGNTLFTASDNAGIQVLDERVAWLISDILSDNQARLPAFGSNSVLQLDRTAAVKTGTTNDFRDNWTVGYTPDLVVGVWVGNANNEAMRNVTGVSGAGPIWHHFTRAVLTGTPNQPFTQPPGLVRQEVCRLSGLLPTENCPYRKWEWFIAGTQPTQYDTFFQQVWLDSQTNTLATDNTPLSRRESKLVLDLPPRFHTWARTTGLPLLADLQPTVITPDTTDTSPLQITYPDPHAIYRLSTALPLESQRLPIVITPAGNFREITIWLNDQSLTTLTAPPYEWWWQLATGEHRLWVEGVDNAGNHHTSDTLTFTVYAAE